MHSEKFNQSYEKTRRGEGVMDAELQKKLENPKMIIYDLETTSVDPRTAEIKFFSYMDLSTGDIRVLKWDNDVKIFVQKLIKNSTFVIGFNNENYDDLILLNHGIDLKYTRLIDIYQIFKARKAVIFKSEPSSLSMKNLIKILDLDNEGKGDIDYKIFQKSEWTQEEISEIVKYAKQDIILTKKLWDFLVQKFEPFKEFVSKENQLRFRYLKSTMGAYAYMVICNHLGIPEVYGSDGGHDEYIGAFVLEPQKEVVKGKILYFDFASLYPNMYVHANLFSSNCSCCTREERWHGNEMFKVEGYYCQKTQGKIEELIKHMFLKRKELKKAGDERQQVYKTCLNSMYGISSKPSFQQLYRPNLASDCTSLGQQCIRYAMKTFTDNGFEILYGDTDSILVQVPEYKTESEALTLSKEISKTISSNFPFPWAEFDFKLEDKLKYLQFFKAKDADNFKKKNYIYLTEDGKMIIKGLDIIQKDCSQVSKIIFEKIIKPMILEKQECKLNKKDVDYAIKEIIANDFSLLGKHFNIRETEDYKSDTSIYAMIKEKYGTGEMTLIKNHRIGAGKGVKYCNIDEAQDLKFQDLDMDDVYSELSPFIIVEKENKTLDMFI